MGNDAPHGIDGDNFFLLDMKFIPGFGKQVQFGLTVWTYAASYFWITAIFGEFASIVQRKRGNQGPEGYKSLLTQPQSERGKGIQFMMECTQLFAFTPFLNQFGVRCLDAINFMRMASAVPEEKP